MAGRGMESLETVRDFIRWGASRFKEAGLVFGHGTDNALDESAALVMHAVHLDIDLPEDYLDAVLTRMERERVTALIESRITTRKPVAYLIHEAWFAGLRFYVDERVLVPRSPIAELIGEQFAPWVDPQRITRILDLCTGSGCIGIACAYAFPDAHVTATDLSDAALTVAQRNVESHGLEQRVDLVQGNLFEALDRECFELIVSNPPYVPDVEVRQLADEFQHEPALGLAAGPDGLDLVFQILQSAAGHLSDTGILVVEVGYSQPALVRQLPDVPFLWLEFEHGGEGVFLLDRQQLIEYRQAIERAASRRTERTTGNE